MRYLGVSRAEVFSPNRVSGDSAIFRAVAAELECRGNQTICMTEHELIEQGIPDGIDGIFQMARSLDALTVLEQAVVPVTNSVQAVLNCGRARQTAILRDSGLIPESLICKTVGVPLGWNSFPCWIKRADSHAVDHNDVQFVQDAGSCNNAMLGFSERGIKECVLQVHSKGWLVKFYGVRGLGLVDCYAASIKDGKFGLERYNEQPDQASVDMDALTSVANRTSDLLDVDVYGGDAVVGEDGKITVIDFNDWPSFRTCTMGAAQKIAELIISKR